MTLFVFIYAGCYIHENSNPNHDGLYAVLLGTFATVTVSVASVISGVI